MNKPDLLEDLLALQYVYGDNSKCEQAENTPTCSTCGNEMDYDKLETKWICFRCTL